MRRWRTCNNRRAGRERAGFTVTLYRADGTVADRSFTPMPNALTLALRWERSAWAACMEHRQGQSDVQTYIKEAGE